jgi:hypothetical protein
VGFEEKYPSQCALVDYFEWIWWGWCRGPDKFFLYEIVANKISSIDVDKAGAVFPPSDPHFDSLILVFFLQCTSFLF